MNTGVERAGELKHGKREDGEEGGKEMKKRRERGDIP
jgi:hypothetical protein